VAVASFAAVVGKLGAEDATTVEVGRMTFASRTTATAAMREAIATQRRAEDGRMAATATRRTSTGVVDRVRRSGGLHRRGGRSSSGERKPKDGRSSTLRHLLRKVRETARTLQVRETGQEGR
jgi:hypothetical protein